MAYEWFEFDGIRSTDFNVGVFQVNNERQNYYGAPSKNIVAQKIAGLNGQRVVEETYNILQITLTCVLLDNTNQTVFRDLNAWLGDFGAHTLVLSRQQWKQYRNVRLVSEIKTDNYGKGSFFTIQLEAYTPIGFSNFTTSELGSIEYNMEYLYNSGLLYVDSGGGSYTWAGAELPNLDIYNGGTGVGINGATPVFTIDGSGTDITITKYSDSARTIVEKELSYGAFSGELVIDCRKRNTFLNGSLNNASFTGEYFRLDGRKTTGLNRRNTIQTGLKNTFEITLDSSASAVNDYYNDKFISVMHCDSGNIYRIKILDYNGTTKVATLKSILPVTVSGMEYAIYDATDGVNYISVTGTGLSITSVDVDFRYTYI